jgi:hypothetical protein
MTLADVYEMGRMHTVSGDVNWWILGPALIAIALIILEHTSSGRSL